jgi:hypothetical protein
MHDDALEHRAYGRVRELLLDALGVARLGEVALREHLGAVGKEPLAHGGDGLGLGVAVRELLGALEHHLDAPALAIVRAVDAHGARADGDELALGGLGFRGGVEGDEGGVRELDLGDEPRHQRGREKHEPVPVGVEPRGGDRDHLGVGEITRVHDGGSLEACRARRVTSGVYPDHRRKCVGAREGGRAVRTSYRFTNRDRSATRGGEAELRSERRHAGPEEPVRLGRNQHLNPSVSPAR